jgi:hypothetical protein
MSFLLCVCLSVSVVAQPSSEVPEGLKNYPVYIHLHISVPEGEGRNVRLISRLALQLAISPLGTSSLLLVLFTANGNC